jgi:hypothetical protein
MPQSAMHKGRLVILAGCAAALVVTLCALRADLLVSRGFAKAFGSQGAPLSFDATAVSGTLEHQGELFSLTRSEDGALPPFARRLAVGDRITITGRDGRQRSLIVVDIKPLSDPLTRVASHPQPERLLVTCRVLEGNAADSQSQVQFLIQDHVPETPPPSVGKAL